jgi:integrase
MRPKLAANTVSQYTIAARKLKKAFAQFAPDQVRSKHVAQFKLSLAGTPNMANRMLSFLRSVFTYAVEWQLVDSNPCIGVKRLAEAVRDRYLTDEEFERIRAVAGARLSAIIDLCYFTGQRIGDVLKIRRSDLLEDGIAFQQQKTGAKLVVLWSPELHQAVACAEAACGGENVRAMTLLHLRGKVLSYRGVRDSFERARLRAGVEDATLHDLRAKSLTDAELQGLDPQALGGHTARAQTERYIRVRRVPRATPPSFGQSLDSSKKKA